MILYEFSCYIYYVCVTTQQPMVSGSLRQRHPPPKKISLWTRRQTSNKEVGDFILKREASNAGFSLKVLFCVPCTNPHVQKETGQNCCFFSLSPAADKRAVYLPLPQPRVASKTKSTLLMSITSRHGSKNGRMPNLTRKVVVAVVWSLFALYNKLSLSHIKQLKRFHQQEWMIPCLTCAFWFCFLDCVLFSTSTTSKHCVFLCTECSRR